MVIGIDFGYSSVKIIQLVQNSQGYNITKIGSKAITDDLNRFDPETISKANWVAAIQDLCQELKINPKKVKKVVSSMDGNQVSVKQISTLEMEEEELTTALEFEAKKHIPLDGTEAVLDFHILGQDKKELDKINVLLVATTKNLVEKHQAIIKDTGFNSGVFDTDSVAIMNCLIHNNSLSENGADVVLNIGNQSTTIVIKGKQDRFFSRELPFAGYQFTKAAMSANNITYTEAEELKIEVGIDSATPKAQKDQGDDFAIKIENQTIYTTFTEELRKTLRYYMKSASHSHYNSFYITGGSANLPGLLDYLNNHLNIELEVLNPFNRIQCDFSIENPTEYAVATGLCLRGFEE